MSLPLTSFISVDPESHFPIQNLPFGAYARKSDGSAGIATRVGDQVVALAPLVRRGLLGPHSASLIQPQLNAFMAAGRQAWRDVRERLARLLSADEPTLRDDVALRNEVIFPLDDAEMKLPCHIGDYTDFYSSREHATNVGSMFRGKENALLPNWMHLPVAYHGRSSSVVVSGTDLHRPHGQSKADDAPAPAFGASRMVDFELEMGFFIGPGNALGRAIPVASAMDHIFGMVLVNDWSARDIQKWEYQPLGPFLAKNFGTSISPWVVMMDALEPFRTSGPDQSDPPVLPYLRTEGPMAYDVRLEVSIQPPDMPEPHRVCQSNLKHMYWNVAQQLAHHTVNGCNLRSGDLLASGTISGPTPDSFGSMLELAWKGTKPLELPGGVKRASIQDGDRVTITGWCQGEGYRVGFGEVTGTILPAVDLG